MRRTGIVVILAWQLTAQNAVVRQGSSPSGDVDFSTAKSTKPARTGAVLPTTCKDGELYFLTNVGLHQCAKGKFAALGSGGTWGTVGGAIAAQTDLWTTLQGKQPMLTGKQTQYVRGDGSLGGLAPSATTDTTDASKITSGTLPAARLPSPTTATIGGLYAAPATAHQWLSNIDAGGQQHFAQPDAGDLTATASGGIQRTQAAKNAEVLSVKDFGAAGDGITDDTGPISLALTAASLAKAQLNFPVGTYIITATTARYSTLPVISGVTIAGSGAGSIIKVKSGSGSYFTLFQCGSDCTFRNFTVDMNSTGNPLTTYSDTMAYARFLVSIAGTNFAMDHVTVKDIDDVNVVYGGVYNSSITNCSFLGIGAGTIPHDHSTLYMAEDKGVIANNLFEGAYIQAPGAGTAIETHGGGMSVTGNVIRNMANGMNITGITVSDSKNVTVTGNSITGAEYGISLWSMAYTGHTTGFGLDGVVVANNSISISQSSYIGTIGSFGGIDIYATNNLPVRNIIIRGNSIAFDLESVAPGALNDVTAGISYWDATGTNSFDNVVVESNSITNSPLYAIRFSANGRNLSVSRNTIINPGSTLFNAIAAYRAGIFLGNSNPVSNLRVIGNLITDNLAATRMVYGVASYGANTGDVVYSGNVISATGATTTSLLGAYYLSSASQLPLIQDIVNVPIGFEFPSKKVANGSTIHSMQAGKSYKVAPDGVTWSSAQDKLAAASVAYDTLLSNDGASGYGSASNLLLRSETFDNPAWQKPGATATVSADATTDPFGGLTADLLSESPGTGTHYLVQPVSLTAGVYHYSIYAKQNARNVGLSIAASYAYFDLTNGTVLYATGGATAAIYGAGNGWYRCDMQTPALPAGITNLSIYTANSAGGISYLGDGVSGVYLWGAQISPGSAFAPYVSTTGSVVSAQAPTLVARGLYVTNPVPSNILGFAPVPTGDVSSSGVVTKVNGTPLAGLGTGILKNTTGTGVPSIAIPGVDYLAAISQVLGAYCGGTITSNVTINLYGDLGYPVSANCSSTSVNVAGVPLRAGTMKYLRVRAGSSSATNGSGTVTVYKNNVLQPLTCTLSTASTCSDLVNSFSIADGDSVSIRVQSTAVSGDTLGNIFAAAQLF